MPPEDDIRSDILSALDAAEKPDSGPATPSAPAPSTPAPTGTEKPAQQAEAKPESQQAKEGTAPASAPEGEAKKPAESKPAEGEAKPAETAPTPLDTALKAPQSWKPTAKAHWNALPLEARQEVARREREIAKTLNEVSQVKQYATQMQEAIRPFEARLQTLGASPHQAVQELLKADYILSASPPPQKAQFMAKLIADYGVDIALLDQALSGAPQAINPINQQVQALLQQQLAPLQQFIKSQAETAQQERERQAMEINNELETMAADTTKYPFFETVREDMADIIEMSAKRGLYLSLPEAYNRAVKLNPEAEKTVQAQLAQQAAAQATAKAQQALRASASVAGSPTGPSLSATQPTDLRSAIEAAMEAHVR